METNRCMNCMCEMHQPGMRYCAVCGFDNMNIKHPGYALRLNSILHGRYLMGRVLGQGGFGITYAGLDLAQDARVAIKEFFPMGMVTRQETSADLMWNPSQISAAQQQEECRNFLKEARKMKQIQGNRTMVCVYDTFLDHGTAYIVMEYVEGETLKQRISQNGPMFFEDCIRLLFPMMEGLVKVHTQGMIHRDISPDNIMIQPDGSVKLLDLGAAKDMTIVNSHTSQVVAKKGFSPVEQYVKKGMVGPWTDVYALCATIYYSITGKVLPDAMERIYLQEELQFSVPGKALPTNVIGILKDGLAVRAEERIRSVEELARRLEVEISPKKDRQEFREEAKKEEPYSEKNSQRQREKFNAGRLSPARTEDFTFTINENGDGIVIKRYKGSLERFAIPEEIDGMPVTEIDDYAFAFYGCENYIMVEIPSTVTVIGNHAFRNCIHLSGIEISPYVTSIGNGAFRGCADLNVVYMPDSVRYIGGSAFFGCSSLSQMKIPLKVFEIKNCTFQGCSNLSSIEFHESLLSIGDGAFYDCERLSAVRIPSAVRHIGTSAFANCTGLTLAELPDRLHEIQGFAFAGCSNLRSIKIPSSVAEIWRWAFAGCGSLQEVEIPASVRQIWKGAFENCRSLKRLKVGGGCILDEGAVHPSVTIERY